MVGVAILEHNRADIVQFTLSLLLEQIIKARWTRVLTRLFFLVDKKDILPAFQHSNIIYQYLRHCDSRYRDRTSQRLSDRIKQHAPKSIRTGQFSQDRSALSRSCKSFNYSVCHDSDTGQHLLNG